MSSRQLDQPSFAHRFPTLHLSSPPMLAGAFDYAISQLKGCCTRPFSSRAVLFHFSGFPAGKPPGKAAGGMCSLNSRRSVVVNPRGSRRPFVPSFPPGRSRHGVEMSRGRVGGAQRESLQGQACYKIRGACSSR